jgi:hypothetical protein
MNQAALADQLIKFPSEFISPVWTLMEIVKLRT